MDQTLTGRQETDDGAVTAAWFSAWFSAVRLSLSEKFFSFPVVISNTKESHRFLLGDFWEEVVGRESGSLGLFPSVDEYIVSPKYG